MKHIILSLIVAQIVLSHSYFSTKDNVRLLKLSTRHLTKSTLPAFNFSKPSGSSQMDIESIFWMLFLFLSFMSTVAIPEDWTLMVNFLVPPPPIPEFFAAV